MPWQCWTRPEAGREEEGEKVDVAAPSNKDIGRTFVASLWVSTKCLICDGQKNMDEFRNKKRNLVIEAVNLACSRVALDHEWISDLFLLMHEHDILRNYDMDVPCIVHWTLLVVFLHGRLLIWWLKGECWETSPGLLM